MRFLILSDIHGSSTVLRQVLDYFDNNRFDRLLILGDILNYGPRNGLPEGLDAQEVVRLLSERSTKIVSVRGNCDSEVDQMLLPFPTMADYALVFDDGHLVFLTHGHIFNEQTLPHIGGVDLFCYGHTHLPVIKQSTAGRPAILNPGSPTFPKGGNPPTFASLCDGLLSLHSLDGGVLESAQIW